ncbi:MAG TPA: gamma-glutamyltransferase family protein [bacterium]|nr:gamma-glutamyltransferase family protein [bacterium]
MTAVSDSGHTTYATRFGLRPVVYGRRGVVATANPLATMAGIRMLAQGGNAVDAAIAAAAAIGVAEPYMSGLAGCGTLMLTRPGQTPKALVFLGRAPAAAVPERFAESLPDTGYEGACVPGNLAAWARVLAEHGTMPLAQVLEPAIEYAERGVPFTPFDEMMFRESAPRLTQEGVATYLHSGAVPRPGALLVQSDLAATLRRIGAEGAGYLYEGPLGQAIVRLMRERGGLLAEQDLREYPESLHWADPIATRYRGVTVYAPPPPTSAVQVLETLGLLDGFDLGPTEHLGPEHVGLVAEAARRARLDTDRFVGDPDAVEVPVDHLLSGANLDALRREIDVRSWSQAGRRGAGAPSPAAGGSAAESGIRSTTHLAAADGSGLAVNITQSLGHGFGCGVVVPGTGVCLNNAMHWFTARPGHPNQVAPRKRHEWPVAPVHVFRDGRFWTTVGTPGSYGILVTTVQVLVNLVDFGLNLQDAIGAPRFRWIDDVADPLPARALRIESRMPEATRAAFADRGYGVDTLGPWSMRVGGVQAVQWDPETGWLAGAADPRRNGYAVAW